MVYEPTATGPAEPAEPAAADPATSPEDAEAQRKQWGVRTDLPPAQPA
jgi:hypothetical protein